MTRPRLLVLGAGIFQLAAIRRARQLDLEVISMDYLPGNIGHRLASRSVDISTTDLAKVVEAASRLGVDGVMTMASDASLPAAAAAGQALGRTELDPEVVAVLTDKVRFRTFQAEHGFSHPSFFSARSWKDAERALTDGERWLVKPALGSGSRGVALISRADPDSARLFEQARSYSASGTVSVEQFIAGDDFTVEGFLLNGRVISHCVTKKHMRGFAVTGHSVPSLVGTHVEERMVEVVSKHLQACGYASGPFDADLRFDGDNVTLLELTPRLGGNGVPLLAEAATGASLLDLTIAHALGQPLEAPMQTAPRPYASLLLFSARRGRVTSVASSNDLLRACPQVEELTMDIETGRTVEAFAFGSHVFGFAIAQLEGTFGAMAQKLTASLALKLEEVS